MMEEEITSVEISKSKIVDINPSLDFCDGIGYIGTFLHADVSIIKNGQERKFKSIEHFLISSKKDIIHVGTALPDGMILSSQPIRIKNVQWERDDIQRWIESSTPIDPVALYNQIKQKMKTLFEFNTETTYDIVTLWSIGTYFYRLFSAYPYLFVNGLKRTGKSKLLHFLSLVCHNAYMSSNLTTASLHRTIESLCSTLLIDEHEFFISKNKLSERQQELRAALLDGYHIGSLALKVEGDKDKRVATYSMYAPKALANIAGLDDVLEDRCIYILMQRAIGDQKNAEIDITDPEWVDIKNKLHRFYLENASVVSELSVVSAYIPEGIQSRERQLWKPIFALAKYFEDKGITDLITRLADYAANSSSQRLEDENETTEILLVKALVEMIKDDGWYPVSTIKDVFAQQFNIDDDTTWINPKTIGRMLKRIGLTEKRRVSKGYEYHLSPETSKMLSNRYASAFRTTTQTTLNTLTTLDDGLVPYTPQEGDKVLHRGKIFLLVQKGKPALTNHSEAAP